MSLNISIDVDGTLVGEDEQLVSGARESLVTLKDKGHRVQLWSAAGAEYAQMIAVKHELATLFDSYATKPDVAVDDIAETTRPAAVVKVDRSFGMNRAIDLLSSEVEDTVESVLSPSSKLKQYVAELQTHTGEVRTELGDLLCPEVPLLPIPFFGNIEAARVVTIGLNPAITEFAKYRGWRQTLDADSLTFRLVNYFRLAGSRYPPPQVWFSETLDFLQLVGCPSRIAAAHVDLCPWTSVAPIRLGAARTRQFWNLVDKEMEAWFSKTIAQARQTVKLIVFLQSPRPSSRERERRNRAEGMIKGVLGPAWRGKIRTKQKEELVKWAWEHKRALREFIGFSNICD